MDEPKLEDVVLVLIELLDALYPGIDFDATFDLLMDMFQEELDPERAHFYGSMIRATAGIPQSKEWH